jgi:hypothetical protein
MRKTRFPITLKLLGVCLAFGLPIVVMFVLMTQAKLTEIRFAEQEVRGDRFQRPLERTLQHVGRHRRAWLAKRPDAELDQEAAAVVQAIDDVAQAEREHGVALQFTPEGLGLRGRAEFTAAGLRAKWQDLLRQSELRLPTRATLRSRATCAP